MARPLLRTAIEAGALRITVDRPQKLNALTWALDEQLLDAVTQAERDDAVHAVVIRGAGRASRAGADIALARTTAVVGEFIRVARAAGIREAIAWRDDEPHSSMGDRL